MIHLLVGSHVKKPDSGFFFDWSRNNTYETLHSYWLSFSTSLPVRKLAWLEENSMAETERDFSEGKLLR